MIFWVAPIVVGADISRFRCKGGGGVATIDSIMLLLPRTDIEVLKRRFGMLGSISDLLKCVCACPPLNEY